ncbi:hypothetical protein [Streptomyces sp. Da 82-17]|uniref:hypothetical protein n=1 Tax=Streptomyces sp. Da 82-17 TaxID=3377116 RepID=UPI0038D440EF
MTTEPRVIADLDVPLTDVETHIERLNAQKRLAEGTAAEARHLGDPTDHAWERLAVDHPEACSHDADYPGWTEHIAALTKLNRTKTTR